MVLHVRMLRRAASGEYDLAPDQLFSTIEQIAVHEGAVDGGEGRQAGAAWPWSRQTILWEAILRTASNLESSTIVLGSSAKMPITEQAREIGFRLGEHAGAAGRE